MTHAPIDDLTVCYTTFNSMRTLPESLEAARSLSNHIGVVGLGAFSFKPALFHDGDMLA